MPGGVLVAGERPDATRHDTHPAALGGLGYSWLELHTYAKAWRRRRGLCRCGADPIPGNTARGKPYRVCARCLEVDRALRERLKRAWAAVPRRVRVGVTGMPLAGPVRVPPPLRVSKRYQEHAARLASIPGRDHATRAARPLTAKQRDFVDALLSNGGNGEHAALAAGYGLESARSGGRAAAVAACRLRQLPHLRAAIDEARLEALSGRARAVARRLAAFSAAQDEAVAALWPVAAGADPFAAALAGQMLRTLVRGWERGRPLTLRPDVLDTMRSAASRARPAGPFPHEIPRLPAGALV